MEEALITRLRGTAAITALVGTSNSRAAIDWIERADVLPCLTLQDVTAGKIYAHDGSDHLANPTIQIDCWATSYGAAKVLARAVIAEMETAQTVGSIQFNESFLVTSRGMEPEDLGSGIKVYRQSLDFSVWWQPA